MERRTKVSKSIELHTLLFLLSLVHIIASLSFRTGRSLALTTTFFMLPLLEQNAVRLLLMPLLVFAARFQQLVFVLLEGVLLQFLDHIETISDLLLVLLLEVDHSVNVHRLLLVLSMLFVLCWILHLLLTVSAIGLVAERTQVLDRDELIECLVVHEEDFFICQSESVSRDFLVAKPCLDRPTTNHILTL